MPKDSLLGLQSLCRLCLVNPLQGARQGQLSLHLLPIKYTGTPERAEAEHMSDSIPYNEHTSEIRPNGLLPDGQCGLASWGIGHFQEFVVLECVHC